MVIEPDVHIKYIAAYLVAPSQNEVRQESQHIASQHVRIQATTTRVYGQHRFSTGNYEHERFEAGAASRIYQFGP